MRSSAIARRYAKALILIGKDDSNAEQYRQELEDIVSLMQNQPMLAQTVTNPLHNIKNRRMVLQSVLKKLQLSKVMNSFILLLFDKGRINSLEQITDYYVRLADELKGVVRANLTTATELSSESFERIRSALSEMTRKEVFLEAQTDAALIGGVVTKIGDLVLDGSIRTQLQNMRESLKRGERI